MGLFDPGHGCLPQPIIAAARLTARRIDDVRAAAALEAFERLLDLGFARLLLGCEERRGGHDPAVDAVAALRHLLFDIGGLQRMRLVGRAEAGERHHLAVADRGHRRDAGADRPGRRDARCRRRIARARSRNADCSGRCRCAAHRAAACPDRRRRCASCRSTLSVNFWVMRGDLPGTVVKLIGLKSDG